MNAISRFKNAFFIDGDKYKKIESSFAEENLQSLRSLSFTAGMIFLIMFLVSFFNTIIQPIRFVYMACSATFFVLFAAAEFCKKEQVRLINFFIYFFQIVLLAFSIIVATIILPDDSTVSYLVLMIISPILFIGRPKSLNGITSISLVIYVLLAFHFQQPHMFWDNMINIIPYGLASLVLTAFIMNLKVQKYLYMSENQLLLSSGMEKEEKLHVYEGFINEMMRKVSDGKDADDVIQDILQYIGKKLNPDRVYIFEDNFDGTYGNTYEWCRSGVKPQIDHSKQLKYTNMLDLWFDQFRVGKNVIIEDAEAYRNDSETLYHLLKSQDVHSLVLGPLYQDGKIYGFFGVDNPPREYMHEISEILYLMQSLLSLILRLRDNVRALEDVALKDSLTGCMNRSALSWAFHGDFGKDRSFSVICCSLNGVKDVNNRQGYEAGDRFICRAADALKDIFTGSVVYRMCGDEFVLVLQGLTEEEVDAKIKLVRLQLGSTVSIGSYFSPKPHLSFDEMLKVADETMHEEKLAL